MAPLPGERVLDLAAGTGTSSVPFATAGAVVVPTDFSLGMLQVGKRREPYLPFVAGDGMHLPFRDACFDAATISFGLRNINDRMAGLREILRVVRPGGRLVVCEFSHPTWAPFRTVYTEYLMRALPGRRPADVVEPGRVRVPRRVDPCLARPGGPRGRHPGLRMGPRAVAQSHGRDRHAAPRDYGPKEPGPVKALSPDHYAFVGRELIHKCAKREEKRA